MRSPGSSEAAPPRLAAVMRASHALRGRPQPRSSLKRASALVRAGLIRLLAVKSVRPPDGLHEIAGRSRLRQAQIHRLRHVIKELAAYLPEETRNSEEVQALAAYFSALEGQTFREVGAQDRPEPDT